MKQHKKSDEYKNVPLRVTTPQMLTDFAATCMGSTQGNFFV
jgi:hypothetical protein